MIKNFFKSRLRSFAHAFDGIGYVFRTQPNAKIHLFFTVIVLSLSVLIHLQPVEIGILVVVIGIVWAAEFFNTAFEATIDLISPQPHPLAKAVKDVAAGGVLISAITAIIIGLVIIVPPLLRWMGIG